MITRRNLLATLPALSASPEAAPACLKLGIATYSLRKFSRPQAIAIARDLGVHYLSVKEFHLPYKDSPAALKLARKEFDAAGLTIASGGVVNVFREPESELRKYFEYARVCGMPMLIMAPAKAQMRAVASLAREYDIRVAVHNHGPEDSHFPTPQSAYEVIRGLERRIGLCMDAGHTARTGADVIKSIESCADRLIDFHIKDLRRLEANFDCEVGQGVLPVARILRTRVGLKFQGVVALEYEADADDPVAAMRASFAYMRGVLARPAS